MKSLAAIVVLLATQVAFAFSIDVAAELATQSQPEKIQVKNSGERLKVRAFSMSSDDYLKKDDLTKKDEQVALARLKHRAAQICKTQGATKAELSNVVFSRNQEISLVAPNVYFSARATGNLSCVDKNGSQTFVPSDYLVMRNVTVGGITVPVSASHTNLKPVDSGTAAK